MMVYSSIYEHDQVNTRRGRGYCVVVEEEVVGVGLVKEDGMTDKTIWGVYRHSVVVLE